MSFLDRRVHKQYRWLALLVGLLLMGCSQRSAVVDGDIRRGEATIRAYGCGACHVIPGVAGAHSYVGPPLNEWAERHYIAGNLMNTPENLIAWLRDPAAIEPGTAMPNVGLSDQEARDISAYLYSLR